MVHFDDIVAAASRIEGKARLTPLLEAPLLNQKLGCRVLVKPECLQLTGSFKFRGAYNRIAQLSPEELSRGVVAYSTGNHAQGVAAAAKMMGTSAIIVVPKDTPAIKQNNTRAWGAELAFYERDSEDRVAVAQAIADEHEAIIVPPFDDPHVIAGQGTIGLEILAQAAMMDAEPDMVVIPAGGGGLTAGIATAIKEKLPNTLIIMAEPASYDDTKRSMAAGVRVANDLGPDHESTFCDALTAPMPGELTFPINQKLVSDVVTLRDETVCQGIYRGFVDFKLVLEPSGAIALAALVSGAISGAGTDIQDKTIVVVCSGGNVEPSVYADALIRGAKQQA
ncbi:MAG: threonine ammonia-lyase [Alphaproteobacteria bacterium]